ncbi:MAG: TonB-dependent receptor, partial [Flavobacterium sp.]
GLVINTNKEGYNDIRTRPVESLFSPNVINGGFFNLQEIPNFNDRYAAESYTNAGFAMIDSKIGSKLRAIYGVRVEKFDLSLKTKNPAVSGNQAELNNIDVLPSVNLTYALNEKVNLRASYYRTLARPEFRELAPFAYYDYENFASVLGNSALKRSLINNADLRYEFYPNPGQIFSVSAFYKQFINAIEPSIEDQNSTPTISYFNSSTATVYGFELEARRSLDFISGSKFFKNTTAYANLSVTRSEIMNLNPNAIAKYRPLVGQSPYVVNAGLQHSELNNKLTFNILYNRIGRRINLVGGTRFPDVYENPRDVLDLQIGYKVMKNRAEVKLNAGDLFNQVNLFYFDYDKNNSFSSSDEILRRYKQGTTFSLSFNYTIR